MNLRSNTDNCAPTLDELVRTEYAEQFSSQNRAIWMRLRDCADVVRILDAMLEDDASPILAGEYGTFYRQVVVGLEWSLLLKIDALVGKECYGASSDTLTLFTLEKRLADCFLAEPARPAFRARMAEVPPSAALRSLAARIKKVRNGFSAHLLWRQDAPNPKNAPDAFTLAELKSLLGELQDRFDRMHWPALMERSSYPDERLNPHIPIDADQAVNALLRDTWFVKQPDGPWWSALKPGRGEEEIQVLARLRARLGLSPP